MSILSCTPENQTEFREALRANPELNDFVSAFYRLGLIDGLRNVVIATPPHSLAPRGVQPVLSYEVEQRIASNRAKGGQK